MRRGRDVRAWNSFYFRFFNKIVNTVAKEVTGTHRKASENWHSLTILFYKSWINIQNEVWENKKSVTRPRFFLNN